jgi:RNA polymerase sigma factor (sigma-70 family)
MYVTGYLEQDKTKIIAWVKDAALGKQEAQRKLYDQYKKAMYNICVRMMGNMDDAADMLQEGFVTAFTKLEQLKEKEKFGGWLKIIVINTCSKTIRNNSKWQFVKDVENVEYYDDEAEAYWWQQLQPEQIALAIEQLPNGCREVFNLYAVEDYKHREIADLLDISENTSKSQYQRAKLLLKNLLIKKYYQ